MADILNPYPPTQTPFDFWGPVYTANDGTLFSPGFTGNTIADSVWDKVFISGAPTPGLAEVVVQKQRDVDKKKAAGSDGARVTLHGLEPATIEIRLKIWTPEQLKALKELWPILLTPAYKTTTKTTTQTVFANAADSGSAGTSQTTTTATGSGSTQSIPLAVTTTKVTKTKVTTPVTFDVSHPALALHGVKSIQILGGSGPDPGPEPRSRVFTIRAIEFLPPKQGKLATTTPDASKGSALDPGVTPLPGTDSKNTGP